MACSNETNDAIIAQSSHRELPTRLADDHLRYDRLLLPATANISVHAPGLLTELLPHILIHERTDDSPSLPNLSNYRNAGSPAQFNVNTTQSYHYETPPPYSLSPRNPACVFPSLSPPKLPLIPQTHLPYHTIPTPFVTKPKTHNSH